MHSTLWLLLLHSRCGAVDLAADREISSSASACDANLPGVCEKLSRWRQRGVPPSLAELEDRDRTQQCRYWAAIGECARNPDFMHARCCMSCLRRRCLDQERAHPGPSPQKSTQSPRPRTMTSLARHDGAHLPADLEDAARELRENILNTRYPYRPDADPCALDNATSSVEEQTYGEIGDSGMWAMLAALRGERLARTSCGLGRDSVFYDVGSGLGRFALYIRLSAACAHVRGVELSQCRHERAAAMVSSARSTAGARLRSFLLQPANLSLQLPMHFSHA